MIQYVQTYYFCQRRIINRIADRQPLRPVRLEGQPLDVWCIDAMGPELNRPRSGKRYMLTMLNLCSQWLAPVSLGNLKTKSIVKALIDTWASTGLPLEIRLDSFSAHKSALMKAVGELLGIQIVFTTPGHKTGVGLAQRRDLIVGRWLKGYLSQNSTNWNEGLNFLLLQHNELVNATTGYSPSELMYGKNLWGGLYLARQYGKILIIHKLQNRAVKV